MLKVTSSCDFWDAMRVSWPPRSEKPPGLVNRYAPRLRIGGSVRGAVFTIDSWMDFLPDSVGEEVVPRFSTTFMEMTGPHHISLCFLIRSFRV
jgi:hypothetical protein